MTSGTTTSTATVTSTTASTSATSVAVTANTTTLATETTSSSYVTVTATSTFQTQTSSTSSALSPTTTVVVSLNTPPQGAITVSQTDVNGSFSTIQAAINSLPDAGSVVIFIYPGTYSEMVYITRTGPLTIYGSNSNAGSLTFTENTVTISTTLSSTAAGGNDPSAPLRVHKNNFNLINVNVQNLYIGSGVAVSYYGNYIGTYGCKFVAYQNTFLTETGDHYIENSYIEGASDYIYGQYGRVFFQSVIVASSRYGAITANGRASASDTGGYVFNNCEVTASADAASGTIGNVYLGHPWYPYARVVFMNSYLTNAVTAAGWAEWTTGVVPNDTSFYEFNNSGAGAWNSGRVSFASNITADVANSFLAGNFFSSTSWILNATAVPTPTTVPSATTTTTASATAISTFVSLSTPPVNAVTVSQTGVNGSFSTIQSAINSLADAGSAIIFIYPGVYTEMVYITRTGPLTIYGYNEDGDGILTYTDNTVTITNNVSAVAIGQDDFSAPLRVHKDDFNLINVNVQNQFNTGIGVAVSYYGTQIGTYGCKFYAYQDTLLTEIGEHYFVNSYIEGAIDYIFGQYSKAFFQSTIMASTRYGYVTANGRASPTDTGAYVFNECEVIVSPNAVSGTDGNVYLGRPWGAYARVIYMNSGLTDAINPAGWHVWTKGVIPNDTSFYEYNNYGLGIWNPNRVSFATNVTEEVANNFTLNSFFDTTSWISNVPKNKLPSIPTATTTATATPTPTNILSINTPPVDAVVVSQTGMNGSYSTIQAAVDSLPDAGSAVIFIYPGVYTEMVYITRTGPLTVYGANNDTGTISYTGNSVTITNNVSAVAVGHDDLSAPLRVHKSNFTLVNVNVQNQFNTGIGVAVSYYGDRIGTYGCKFYAYQDTLLTQTGQHYFFNSYIEGAVDFIFGQYSKAFFQSTILSSIRYGYITANGRNSSTDPGGYVFNDCEAIVSPDAVNGTVGNVYLGRPWRPYARVVYMNSDLTDAINPAGWHEWSTGVYPNYTTYYEYNNYGAGSWNSNRVSFAENITEEIAANFTLDNFFDSISWIYDLDLIVTK
ncbi:hypothetical protein HK100_007659 [Physocladia obscura]|uniref:pectinesterase n=1 Tax=Physocladia obscura TaxID=109957 RepID=A0AAD5SQJ1_9FUNG|nr:hypothetical protein HK100_007659 [Physocladia obscura]